MRIPDAEMAIRQSAIRNPQLDMVPLSWYLAVSLCSLLLEP